jgi:NTP pyrophosphatase (non-canonical NTP hydrolase)
MAGTFTMDTIQKFIEADYSVWNRELDGLDQRTKALAMLARICESAGELSREATKKLGIAHGEGQDWSSMLDVALSAVIMNTHYLAVILGVDMFEAFKKEMMAVQARIRLRDE